MEIVEQPVSQLTGIGSQSIKRLRKLDIQTIQDLLFHLPHRYEDRTKVYPLTSLVPGQSVLVQGKIEYTEIIYKKRAYLICRISDSTGILTLRFFHFSAKQKQNLSQGTLISCFGEVRDGFSGLEMIHPDYKIISDSQSITQPSLTAIYPTTEGLRQSTLRKAIDQAISLCLNPSSPLTDWLPQKLLEEAHFPSLKQALLNVHKPDPSIKADFIQNGKMPALKRLAFEELLAHHLALLASKQTQKKHIAPQFIICESKLSVFLSSLPFSLTQAQNRVIQDIKADCLTNKPMLRLIQGDVGSGKTIVAAYATLLAVFSDYQVAMMAPTELLAEQHYRNFNQWFSNLDIHIAYLSGQIKGKQREQTLTDIQSGHAKVIIGTHALFQDSVQFNNLGLTIIDEQHRFGVHQRLALREKSQHHQLRPHQLIMTATPIPRTLAMLQYSDLDISIIDELPPGRKPVITRVLSSEKRDEIIQRINEWAKQKHQSYWVCTLIEESESLQCEAAEKTADYLKQKLPDLRIALVHGRMKPSLKEQTMQQFKNHDYDLLVATTVIEVGVDVPNASLMVIDNAERLGLSQLHQLRGRVGRGSQESYCVLVYQPPLSETSYQRLGILREHHDGFIIAEKDLSLRGPGDVMGTRQTGLMQFKIADLSRDKDLLDEVQKASKTILNQHPHIPPKLIQRWLGNSTHYLEV